MSMPAGGIFGDAGLTVPFSVIPAIKATWLRPGIIPNRTPVFLVAPGGTGKGLAIAAFIAMVTRGWPFPGEPEDTVYEPESAVLIAPEDDPNEDLAFRLRAAGADLELVHNLTVLPDGSNFALPGNIAELRQAISEISETGPRVALSALDPLSAVCPRNLTTVRAARDAVDPLTAITQDTGTAMIISHHTPKDGRRVAGSKGLTDTARMVWMIERQGNERVMRIWKTNRTPGTTVIRYRIEGEEENAHAVFSPAELSASGSDTAPAGSRAAKLRLIPGGMSEQVTRLQERRRRSLTAALLSGTCPHCPAGEQEPCSAGELEMCDLGGGVTVHTVRILAAIAGGKASYGEVLAHFGQNPPAVIAAAAAEAEKAS